MKSTSKARAKAHKRPAQIRSNRVSDGSAVSAVRLPRSLTARIDTWAEKHEVHRSEAIRLLVELGLTVKPSRAPTRKAAARAAELASDVIDSHADKSAPAMEQESRKRRLLTGPSAFRGMRKDRSK